jgi:hypothetical protein
MKNHDELTHEIRHNFNELGKHAAVANEKLRVFLSGLGKADMIARINQLNLSDSSLVFLCEGIALKTEDYEICAAVEEIKKYRAAKWTKVKDEILKNTPTPPTSDLPTLNSQPQVLPS